MKAIKLTKFTLALIVLLVLIGTIGVWFFQRPGPSAIDVRNVLLISIDTCRADYLSCYGYFHKITPNIDDLAEEGILFANAYSPVPITLPAHGSMLTGTIPPYHGVHDNNDYRLGLSNETLAEIMSQNGFTTAAIISAFVLDSKFGLNQGFDYYNDRFEEERNTVGINERKGEETSRLAIEWLDKHKDDKFFLFLHYFDPHQTYEPPEPFASMFHDNLYAGEIAYTDHCIGQVIRKLKDLRLYESTLIIITGDHGEMLGEHGEPTHMYFIYQSAIKVPLIFKLPGRYKTKRIHDPVGLIDIVPTICRTLGIEVPDQVQGEDLSGYFIKKQRSVEDRHLYCESLYPTKYDANSLLGVVTDQWKYIQTTRPELYDIVEDPRETTNLIEQQPHLARILQDRLRQILEKTIREGDSDSKLELNEEDRKRMESLGYLARTSVNEDFKFDQSKDDPKNLIDFYRWDLTAFWLIAQKNYAEAKITCEKMLMERPQYLGTYLSMAEIAKEQNNIAGAISYLTEAIRLKPDDHEAQKIKLDYARAQYDLACVLAHQGNLKEAIRHYSEALRVYPRFEEAHNKLGITLAARGKITEAINHFYEALNIDPGYAEAHMNLGNALKKQGRTAEAISHYSEALRIDPDHAEVHNNLGAALANDGRTAEAIVHFREALRIRPDIPSAHKNLKRALAELGNIDDAIN